MTRRRGERVRPERLAEQIRMDTAVILQNLKDPRLPLVTCTRVQVTGDLKHAKLYVSVLGSESDRKRAMEVLERATGYVRHLLSERLRLRTAPEIRFLFDPSVEYGIRLEQLLDSTRPEASSGASDSSEPEERADEPERG